MILNKNEAVLLLGTNLGNRMEFLDSAKREISINIGPTIKKSNIYESGSWGYESPNKFLNQVIIVICKYTPKDLLTLTKEIESDLGKTSNSNITYADRPIDIDILFFDNQIVKEPDLIIPHPQIQNRKFTLVPLCNILPHLVHPILHKRLIQLNEESKDQIEPSFYREKNDGKD